MHSFFPRLNAIFAFSLTVTGVLALCLYGTSFLYTRNGLVQLDSSKILVKQMTEFGAGKKKNDLAFLTFSMRVDLEPLFNWNVKQLFLYLTAEYKTDMNAINQVVLWDKIVLKGDNYKIDLRDAKPEYSFWDDGNGLQGHKNITLYLSWNVIPNVGSLPNIAQAGRAIAFSE